MSDRIKMFFDQKMVTRSLKGEPMKVKCLQRIKGTKELTEN